MILAPLLSGVGVRFEEQANILDAVAIALAVSARNLLALDERVQAFGGIARMLGPLWSGAAFQHLGIRTPFWLAALLMAAVWVFSGTVHEEGTPEDLSGEAETILP